MEPSDEFDEFDDEPSLDYAAYQKLSKKEQKALIKVTSNITSGGLMLMDMVAMKFGFTIDAEKLYTKVGNERNATSPKEDLDEAFAQVAAMYAGGGFGNPWLSLALVSFRVATTCGRRMTPEEVAFVAQLKAQKESQVNGQ